METVPLSTIELKDSVSDQNRLVISFFHSDYRPLNSGFGGSG